VSAAAVDSLARFAETGERFLLWCSIPEPHPPYRPPAGLYRTNLLPEFEPWTGDDVDSHAYVRRLRDEWRHLTPLEWRQLVSAYLGMVELADRFVGEVVDAVAAAGLAEDTGIILTADHGDMAGEHGMMLKFTFREAAMRVPLVVVSPGLKSEYRDDLVESLDVFSTVLDLLGVEPPEGTLSRSLVRDPLRYGGAREFVYGSYGTDLMIRNHEWKLNSYDGEPAELFRVGRDPAETTNLIDSSSTKRIRDRLARELEAWRAGLRS